MIEHNMINRKAISMGILADMCGAIIVSETSAEELETRIYSSGELKYEIKLTLPEKYELSLDHMDEILNFAKLDNCKDKIIFTDIDEMAKFIKELFVQIALTANKNEEGDDVEELISEEEIRNSIKFKYAVRKNEIWTDKKFIEKKKSIYESVRSITDFKSI